ncbi:MAG: hypothetical protein MRERV_43c002 [Mycoplasmataceae bacterium RV_VA103A]|nr:MAG: hypothetical protein MRERV_43c002 [Mycoplasmataceae bacterium RV_VA103A]
MKIFCRRLKKKSILYKTRNISCVKLNRNINTNAFCLLGKTNNE